MAMTESTMLALGASLPEFSLPDTEGNRVSTRDFAGRPLLVMFICNHCPYVIHVSSELSRLGHDYADSPLGILAIQSNDVEAYPADGLAAMVQEKQDRNYPFPYLYDDDQSVAKALTAACTPDFFLFDAGYRLVYRGRLDESRPERIRSGVYDSTRSQPTGAELRPAIEAALQGRPPIEPQWPSLGCNIKWKPGNEPDYFA